MSTWLLRPLVSGALADAGDYAGAGLAYIQSTYGPPKNYVYGMIGAPYFGTLDPTEISGSLQSAVNSSLQISQQYGIALVGYEGGQGLSGGNDTDENLFNTNEALQSSPQMTAQYYALAQMWKSVGGDMLMFFTNTGVDSYSGYWGHLPLYSLMDNLSNPACNKYNAIASMNNLYGCNCGNAAPPPAPPPSPTPPPPAPPPPPPSAKPPAPPPAPASTQTSAHSSSSSTSAQSGDKYLGGNRWWSSRYGYYSSPSTTDTPHH